MISPEVIDYIKDKVNIVNIIAKEIEVKKVGYKYVSKCPFCNSENETIDISVERQFFRCKVCNEGGNVFSFIQRLKKISFPNAVRTVAELGGLDFTKIVKEKDNSLHLVVSGSEEEKEKVISFLKENGITYVTNKKE